MSLLGKIAGKVGQGALGAGKALGRASWEATKWTGRTASDSARYAAADALYRNGGKISTDLARIVSPVRPTLTQRATARMTGLPQTVRGSQNFSVAIEQFETGVTEALTSAERTVTSGGEQIVSAAETLGRETEASIRRLAELLRMRLHAPRHVETETAPESARAAPKVEGAGQEDGEGGLLNRRRRSSLRNRNRNRARSRGRGSGRTRTSVPSTKKQSIGSRARSWFGKLGKFAPTLLRSAWPAAIALGAYELATTAKGTWDVATGKYYTPETEEGLSALRDEARSLREKIEEIEKRGGYFPQLTENETAPLRERLAILEDRIRTGEHKLGVEPEKIDTPSGGEGPTMLPELEFKVGTESYRKIDFVARRIEFDFDRLKQPPARAIRPAPTTIRRGRRGGVTPTSTVEPDAPPASWWDRATGAVSDFLGGSGSVARDKSSISRRPEPAQANPGEGSVPVGEGVGWVSPVSGAYASGPKSGFMASRGGRGRRHSGNDLQAADGSTVVAAADGEILYVGDHSGYGGTIDVLHDSPDGRKVVARYATHTASSSVPLEVGQKVSAGQQIGVIGAGHLHHEIRDYDSWLAAGGAPGVFVGARSGPSGPAQGLIDPSTIYGASRGQKLVAGQHTSAQPEVVDETPRPRGRGMAALVDRGEPHASMAPESPDHSRVPGPRPERIRAREDSTEERKDLRQDSRRGRNRRRGQPRAEEPHNVQDDVPLADFVGRPR